MNDGSLSLLVALTLLLLLWGEWFYSDLSRIGLKKKTVALFLIAWAFAGLIPFSYGKVEGSFALFLYPPTLYLLAKRIPEKRKVALLANGLFLAAIYVLTEEVLYNDPILLIWEEPWITSPWMGLLLFFFSSSFQERLLLLLLSSFFGEAMFFFDFAEEMGRISFFSAYQMDSFFLTLLFLSFYSLLMGRRDPVFFRKDRLKSEEKRSVES
ncbi:YphA family membrane protein [Thermicanus aegyptius]|uniref:YphA family membrane protein n=1 Tax=Thermicanus aegyptius TaxID=94009 RepID=UPI00041941D2|nr:hypothetical protein [Thermicanus aegyptius]